MTHKPAQRWRREGLLVSVKAGHPWWRTHAQLPTALPLSDRLWRIYFTARDSDNRSRILAVDVDPGDKMRVLAEYFDPPVLDLGPPGAFDHAVSLHRPPLRSMARFACTIAASRCVVM